MSLTKVTYSMIAGSEGNVLDYGAVANDVSKGAVNVAAFNAAIVANGRVYIPSGTYTLNATVNLGIGTIVYGDGMGNTILTSTATGYAICYPYVLDNAEVEAPKLYDFTLNATNGGIQLNDIAQPIADSPPSQQYLMRFRLINLLITSGAVGFEIAKGFDGIVEGCKFANCTYGIRSLGTDISTIRENRFVLCSVNAIKVDSTGTFGSQMWIVHNDILVMSGTLGSPSDAFISSSDQHVTIENNYFESQSNYSDACIRIKEGTFDYRILNNRVECNATQCTNWLVVEALSAISASVIDNSYISVLWGDALYNSGNGIFVYGTNAFNQTQLRHWGNHQETGFPFNTALDTSNFVNQGPIAAILSPNAIIPDATNYVLTGPGGDIATRLKATAAFLLPPYVSFGSLIVFTLPCLPGTFKIDAEVSDGFGTTVLSYQIFDDTTSKVNTTLTATAAKSLFSLTASVVIGTTLVLKFFNGDTVNNHTIRLHKVMVTRL